MKTKILTFLIFGIYFLNSSLVFSYSDIAHKGTRLICTLGNIDDGDTFDLICNEKIYPNVRLLGINTPDKNQDEKGYKHCFYNEAKDYISKQKGRIFETTFYGEDLCKDPYKGCRNLVRLIDITNGSDLGRNLITRGYAFSWTRFSSIPFEIRVAYNNAESISKEFGLGLWRSCSVDYNIDSGYNSSIPDKMTK